MLYYCCYLCCIIAVIYVVLLLLFMLYYCCYLCCIIAVQSEESPIEATYHVLDGSIEYYWYPPPDEAQLLELLIREHCCIISTPDIKYGRGSAGYILSSIPVLLIFCVL